MCGWQYLSDKPIKRVRKARACIWCGETIESGQSAHVQNGLIDGDFQSNSYHPECHAACDEWFKKYPWEDCFEPYESARGSTLHKSDYRMEMEQHSRKEME